MSDAEHENKLWMMVAGARTDVALPGASVQLPGHSATPEAKAQHEAEQAEQLRAYQDAMAAMHAAMQPLFVGQDGGIVLGACLTQILGMAHMLPDLRSMIREQLAMVQDQVAELPVPKPVTLAVAKGH